MAKKKSATKKKKVSSKPKIMDMIEDSLHGLNKVKDVKTTIRDFNKLKFPEPKAYGSKEIIKLRIKKLGMSQAAFAIVCNAKLSTLQKWESGTNRPTPPVNRLLQLIERGALATIQ
jgi:DNA-binding transcriptional regulator YiaG